MFRKLMLTAVLAAGTLTGLTATTATADEPNGRRDSRFDQPNFRRGDGHDHGDRRDRFVRYEVLYRHRGHWDCYGTFRDRDDAERAARQLRWRGFDVRIERERGR